MHNIAYQYYALKVNIKMKLSEKALQEINNPNTRLKLALALGLTEQSIIRLISKNHDALTKAAALKVIKSETGMKESQILVEEVAA
jgi:hypothetical protein